MANEIQVLNFKQFGEGCSRANTLRSISQKGGALLVSSRSESTPPLGADTTFSVLDTGDQATSWKAIATVSNVVPARIRWDAANDSNGGLQLVHEVPGGAINALELRRASGTTQSLTGQYPLQDFSQPRFSKFSGAPPDWITAVLDHRSCVALPLTRRDPYVDLGECMDGMIVSTGSVFVFVSKTRLPGPVRGNSISPGRLQARLFNSSLQPSALPVEVTSDPVFQFDADIIAGRLVITATTSHGLAVLAATLNNLHFSGRRYAASADLFFPTLLSASGSRAMLYTLAGVSSDNARVMAAEIEIP